MSKKRIVKDYDQLPPEVIDRLKLEYPQGFSDHLIKFVNAKGKTVSALPFETEEIYYLVRMTEEEAIQIIEDDEDYDDLGNLDEDFKVSTEDEIEMEDVDEVADDIPDEQPNYDDYEDEDEDEDED